MTKAPAAYGMRSCQSMSHCWAIAPTAVAKMSRKRWSRAWPTLRSRDVGLSRDIERLRDGTRVDASRAADLLDHGGICRSQRCGIGRVVDDGGAEGDHLAHAFHAVRDHGHGFAVLARGLHEAPAVLVQHGALPRGAEHAQVLGEVRGPQREGVDARHRGDLVETLEGA